MCFAVHSGEFGIGLLDGACLRAHSLAKSELGIFRLYMLILSLMHPPSVLYMQAMGADWVVASGHKMCGPSGIGFLWGREEILMDMQPWMGGGEMIQVSEGQSGH